MIQLNFYPILHLFTKTILRTLEFRTKKAVVRKWHVILGTIIQHGGLAARDGRVTPSGQYIESIRLSSVPESLADEVKLTMQSKHYQFSKILKVKFFLSNAISFSVLGSRARRQHVYHSEILLRDVLAQSVGK